MNCKSFGGHYLLIYFSMYSNVLLILVVTRCQSKVLANFNELDLVLILYLLVRLKTLAEYAQQFLMKILQERKKKEFAQLNQLN